MNNKPHAPIVKKLVLIGGGHSHLAVLKYFAMNPVPGLGITLISRDINTPYSGSLAAYISGQISLDEMHIDLRPLASFANAQIISGTVENIDASQKRIFVTDRPPISYDILSINTGSSPNVNSITGANEFSTSIKPINNFLDKWHQLKSLIETGTVQNHVIAFVGAGPACLEIALNMRHRLNNILKKQKQNIKRVEIHVFGESSELLLGHNEKFRQILLKTLAKSNIKLHLQHEVTAIDENTLHCRNGRSIRVDNVFISTHAAAPSWLSQTELNTDADGFLVINQYLQSISHPEVFAAGDVASMLNTAYPKSGVYAVRQGLPLAKNLHLYAFQKRLKKFIPQKRSLILIGTGKKYVIATRGKWASSGKIFWWLKNYLDSSFVRKYSELPPLIIHSSIDNKLLDEAQSHEVKELLMRCKGCGSKVGPKTLKQVIANLATVQHDNILSQLETTEDAAILEIPANKLLVQTIDSLPALFDDPFLFGKIASNHCLNDIYAMGASPHSALANVILSAAGSKILEEELELLMQGVTETLNAHNTALIGGHTSQGEELNLGLAINGLVSEEDLLNKSGVQANDFIILSKALGTGTLFACDMARKAKSTWIDSALDSMLESNQQAAETFRKFDVHACTDVSGFGLANHLLEMLTDNKAHMTLSLNKILFLPGAISTLKAGFLSSSHQQNFAFGKPYIKTRKSEKHAILFDPQTSGGLIAAVPEGYADECLEELSLLNYEAAIIGQVLSLNNPQAEIKLI